MYKRIMVPTDCSGFDREAVRAGLRIAERSGAKLMLVRVLTTGAYFGAGVESDGLGQSVGVVRHEYNAALAELWALAAECRHMADVDVTTVLQTGPVSDALERYARQNDVDLIVISSHARGGVSRVSLGSVTDSLIRCTTVPVLIVKPSGSYLNPEVRGAFDVIVVPLDDSALAEQILEPVLTLASLEGPEIVLLNVVRHENGAKDSNVPGLRAPWWEKDVASAKAHLERVAADVRRRNVRVRSEVIVGDNVAEEIASYAVRQNADLIAIATHGRGGLTRVLRGSIADALTRLAKSCILVFHPTEAAANNARVASNEFAGNL